MLARIGAAALMLSLSATTLAAEAPDNTQSHAATVESATPEIVVTAEKLGADMQPPQVAVAPQAEVQRAVLADLTGRLSRNVGSDDNYWEE